MKKIKIIVLSLGILSLSFQNNKFPQQSNDNLKHLQVKITGMTCEIGCAHTIASKISRMKGVKFASVSFAKSLGPFTFDPKVTSATEIIKKINGIGCGKPYKVIESKEVKKF